MKKVLYLGMLVVATHCSAANTDKMEEAIEKSLLSQVKAQSSKIDRDEEMTPQARKKLYRRLYDSAGDITAQRKESISLTGDWRDIAHVGGGALLGSLSAVAFVFSAASMADRPVLAFRLGVFGIVSTCLSGYHFYKGISCSHQKADIDTARTVEKFLKGKLNAEELEKE